jgi:glycosyltransferase involved in cell wall biosynthesis
MSTPAERKMSSAPARLALVVGPDTMRRTGRLVHHLTVGLLDEPIRVTVVAPQGTDLSVLPSPPVETLLYPAPRFRLRQRKVLDSIMESLTAQDVELVHAVDVSAAGMARRICQPTGWPYFVSVLGLTGLDGLTVDERCRGLLAGSLAIRARLLELRLAGSDMIHLVRPGIHAGRSPSCFADGARSIAILAAGDLDEPEPFLAMLEAFAAIRKSGYDCVFFLVGNGPAEHSLRLRTEALGLSHYLTFVDRPADMQLADIFRAADMLVFPQSSGQLEIDILQAMAVGLPVLYGSGCVGDFVIDAETAMHYPANDSAGLATRIRLLLDNRVQATQLAQSAQRYVRENHSPAKLVSTLAGLYRQYALAGRTLVM